MIEYFNTMEKLLPNPNEGVEKKGRKLKGCAFVLILLKIYSLSPIDFSKAKTPLSTAEIVTQYLFTAAPLKALYIFTFMNALMALGFTTYLLGTHLWKIYQEDKPPFDPSIRSFAEIARKDSSTITTRWQRVIYQLALPIHQPIFYFSKTLTYFDRSLAKAIPLFWSLIAFVITIPECYKLINLVNQILP
ncbi:hypothetical protein [Halodesulfovibrio aestuarii]|uniref:hypothetical protein n=1 Tax=Halodesulfovibrio aestuarii TaxID=126333 RepID=UPI003D3527D0